MRVGVLAIQGSVKEHIEKLKRLDGITPVEAKDKETLKNIDALILPGGESTAIGKMLNDFDLKDAIIDLYRFGMPIWGTCAGMILMAKHIANDDKVHLGIMDIKVRRNAYGSQLDSFTAKLSMPDVSKEEVDAVFIRAPYIEDVGENVKVLSIYDGKIVAAREGNLFATSFHPELTDDLSFYKYFLGLH
ncbi:MULTISPECIES: pyridoxal 5'-phosphate synthase glutaminase subunit PdxT [Thermoanaerobacterium]|uniref:Pyridoxal 5'-phosphate synthase subunit PdxT n=2 Tax=Thermoanaerobacterium TaxID=28895 RepID=W9EEK6_9THEO|nr:MULTISPECIES: pyridoxal 5'-phosphate synthase glutaminase subunit PdxT [Thermoanaerobacterium]AFK86442.1 Glutamine amidotransferase subunit pdxT [Thermoanaerobacterium saccharolyticum JW/SL-YS485]ETO38189.1 Glutamine amidotransferase subunit pdxT [Thermoanaerobacterium aotearoense SCUT27]